jgi:hypothetical protein
MLDFIIKRRNKMFDVKCLASAEDEYGILKNNIYTVYQVFLDGESPLFFIYAEGGWSVVPCELFTVESNW